MARFSRDLVVLRGASEVFLMPRRVLRLHRKYVNCRQVAAFAQSRKGVLASKPGMSQDKHNRFCYSFLTNYRK